MYCTSFYVHGSLNDFLSTKKKHKWIAHHYHTASSVKDAIEAIGVPHVEIRVILVNGNSTDLHYLLQPEDRIEVFPFEDAFPAGTPQAFVLDVHLGKLARLLRMLGIDTLYQNDFSDKELVEVAEKENRSVLTRDIGVLKHKVLKHGYWLRSQHPEEQVTEVIKRFSLCPQLLPFSRCLACNGLFLPVSKPEIFHLIPVQTQRYFDEFYQCAHCKKVYWKGSHFENMQPLIQRIRSVTCQGFFPVDTVS